MSEAATPTEVAIDARSEAEIVNLDRLKTAAAKAIEAAQTQQMNEIVDMFDTMRDRETPEKENSRRVIEVLAPAPPVPYGAAGRTQLASLSDARYATLPAWQRAFRNADCDMMVKRTFMALSQKDDATLRRLHDETRHMRATLAEGDSSVAGAVFDGTGGQALPLPVANYINQALYRLARWRALTRVATATTGASLRIPLQTTVSTSLWEPEADTIVAGEPSTSDALNLQLQKLTSLSVITNELIEDGDAFSVVAWMIEDVVMQMAEKEDEALYSSGAGTASNEPNGFEASDTTLASAPTYYVPVSPTQDAIFTTAAALTYAHMVKMFYALPEKERMGAIWTANDTVMEQISLLLDGNLRPIFRVQDAPGDIIGDAPASAAQGTIFRRPVWNLPGKTGGAGENIDRIYFLNPLRTYAILEKAAVRVEASREAGFSNDTTHYRFIRRVDGGVIGNNISGRPQYVYTGNLTA